MNNERVKIVSLYQFGPPVKYRVALARNSQNEFLVKQENLRACTGILTTKWVLVPGGRWGKGIVVRKVPYVNRAEVMFRYPEWDPETEQWSHDLPRADVALSETFSLSDLEPWSWEEADRQYVVMMHAQGLAGPAEPISMRRRAEIVFEEKFQGTDRVQDSPSIEEMLAEIEDRVQTVIMERGGGNGFVKLSFLGTADPLLKEMALWYADMRGGTKTRGFMQHAVQDASVPNGTFYINNAVPTDKTVHLRGAVMC